MFLNVVSWMCDFFAETMLFIGSSRRPVMLPNGVSWASRSFRETPFHTGERQTGSLAGTRSIMDDLWLSAFAEYCFTQAVSSVGRAADS